MKFLGALLLLALLCAGVAGYVIYVPYGPTTETFVDIASGTGTARIGEQLQSAKGVIRSQYGLDVLRLMKGGSLKAGEYRFDHPVPLTEIYSRLVRGDVYTRTLKIPEVQHLRHRTGRGGRWAWIARGFSGGGANHTELIAKWVMGGGAAARSLEGIFFPIRITSRGMRRRTRCCRRWFAGSARWLRR